jgi:hypothetical protein
VTAEQPDFDSWRIPVPVADRLISFALVLATLAAYARVFRFGFIILDDGQYVYGNTHLHGGWTLQTLKNGCYSLLTPTTGSPSHGFRSSSTTICSGFEPEFTTPKTC